MALLARRSAAIPLLMSLLLPAGASADIYKWTDEQGGIVYSNSPPENPKAAGNVERVIKERPAPPREQVLQEKIEALERRLQTQSYTPPAPPAPSVAPPQYHDGAHYHPPPPPPVYIVQAAPVYTPVYYPAFPLVRAHSYVVHPARSYGARPVFHGGAHGALHIDAYHRLRR